MRTRSTPLRLSIEVIVFLILPILSAGCGGEKKVIGPVSPPSMQAGEIANIANDISRDVGKVIATNTGGPRRVIIFEETHGSRTGQIEIAVMLLRLHDKYGLRRISLEGTPFDDGALNVKWFHDLAGGDRALQTAVRLLREGEISGCELISLVFPDVEVRGNEKADEYGVTLSGPASTASMHYLITIAQQSLSQDQIRHANELIQQQKLPEAVKYIIETNDWTKSRYEKLTNKNSVVSIEEMISLLQEIESKAAESGATIDADARRGMADAINFFETARKRSHTIVANTNRIASDTSSGGIVALDVGAAHTSAIMSLLKEAGTTFAVIRPASLATQDERGDLRFAEYERKEKLASVDLLSGLGAYLDGRQHKPAPVVHKQWFKSKAEVYLATQLITAAAAGGEPPPFKSIGPKLAAMTSARIDPRSFEIIDVGGQKRPMFKVTARTDDDDPSKTVVFWVGGWHEPPGPPKGPKSPAGAADDRDPSRRPLEQLLLDAREDLRKEGTADDAEAENQDDAKVTPLPITKDTKALFAKSPEAVRRLLMMG